MYFQDNSILKFIYFMYFQTNTILIFLCTFSMLNKKAKPANELKYKHYRKDDMIKALQAVRSGNMSQRVACKVYNVKQTSLQRRLHGITADNASMGGPTVLTAAEEDALEEYIILMMEISYPLTTKQLNIEV